VQLSYAIGVAEPVSVMVNTEKTGVIPDERITKLIRKHFPLKPLEIIKHLKLRRPIYQETARHGHFGRNHPDFTWEKLDKVKAIQADLKKMVK
jgi:S-adenosylmethionine synthetase